MELFSQNLRRRVEELSLSLAEAARRCDLSERRFANYATGSREPDLATLVKIAKMLDTTPDALLGVAPADPETVEDECALLRQQLAADARPLDAGTLRLIVGLVRTVLEHGRERAGGKAGRRK